MKKNIYFLFFIAFFGIQLPAKAILVNIPDANLRTRLQTLYPTCFTGAQMETTCTNITTAGFLDVSALSIASLSGVEHFTALTTLRCNNNLLTSLPTLSPILVTLYCHDNQLTSLPALPNTMNDLRCQFNALTTFPAISATNIQLLRCNNNALTTLPALPAGLLVLYCQFNQLTSLPTVPNSVFFLYCNNNQLVTLPTLPTSLGILICNNNLMTSFPAVLPNGVSELNCSNNLIPSLPTLSSTNLQIVDCSNNRITLLAVLPAAVLQFNCSNNLLTSLPTPFGNFVSTFNCSGNLLDFADLEAITPRPATYNANPQAYNLLPATQAANLGATFTLNGTIAGTLNQYQWYKDNTSILGATNANFSKTNITAADAGVYKCVVTSTFVGVGTTTGVVITSTNVTLAIKADQTITFGALANKTVGNAPFNLTATASSSLVVSYASSNTAVATVLGNLVTIVGAGTTNITASQAGNTAFNPAPNVVQSLVVVAAIDPATSLDNNNQKVTISPNPTENSFEIDFNNVSSNIFSSLEIKMMNVSGKTIFQNKIENSSEKIKIDISYLPAGMYFVQWNNGKEIGMRKIIKK